MYNRVSENLAIIMFQRRQLKGVLGKRQMWSDKGYLFMNFYLKNIFSKCNFGVSRPTLFHSNSINKKKRIENDPNKQNQKGISNQ